MKQKDWLVIIAGTLMEEKDPGVMWTQMSAEQTSVMSVI